jgi:hypothetical protein
LVSDDGICGEPEEPVAGHVVVGSDGVAIYSCDFGYQLLAEPNRTCERDGQWMGHAPQCEGMHIRKTIRGLNFVWFLLTFDHFKTNCSCKRLYIW